MKDQAACAPALPSTRPPPLLFADLPPCPRLPFLPTMPVLEEILEESWENPVSMKRHDHTAWCSTASQSSCRLISRPAEAPTDGETGEKTCRADGAQTRGQATRTFERWARFEWSRLDPQGLAHARAATRAWGQRRSQTLASALASA